MAKRFGRGVRHETTYKAITAGVEARLASRPTPQLGVFQTAYRGGLLVKYKCSKCGKVVERDSASAWINSFCTAWGRVTRLVRVK